MVISYIAPQAVVCKLTDSVKALTPTSGMATWPHPFFILDRTPEGKSFAPFMPPV